MSRSLFRSTRPALVLAPALAFVALGGAQAAAAPGANIEVGALNTTLIESSAFGEQSYRVRNTGDQPITNLRIDLAAGPTMFPDIVFDPFGGAGNEVGKEFTVDEAPALLEATPTYLNGNNDVGYTALDVALSPGLAPETELKFSIDTDPTVLRDSIAGPNAKISGAEHHGATVTLTFQTDAGAVELANDLRKEIGSDIQSSAVVPAATPQAPVVTPAAGIVAPAVVRDQVQELTVTGAPGASGFVLVAEGHLFLAGTEGFEVDPFEANVLVGYGEYPFTLGANGSATVPVSLTRRLLSSVADAPAGFESEEIGRNYITAWTSGPNGRTSPVSDPVVLEWDGTPPAVPVPDPPMPLPIPPAPPVSNELIQVPAGILGLRNCGPIAPPPPANTKGGTIALTAEQLGINQRIGQAAIRRLNAIEKWIGDGIEGRDLCGGTIGPDQLSAGLVQRPGPAPLVSRADPRPLRVPKAPDGAGSRITLTPGQLRINQRIYRAALLRSRALDERLRGALTGGDIVDGSLGRGRFAVPVVAGPATAAAQPSATESVSLTDKGAPITLSSGQLRTNQKIAQRAVREANALRSKLERGLLGTNFRPNSIGAEDLSSED